MRTLGTLGRSVPGTGRGPMNILDIIKNRRSVREFEDREIPESAIDVLIEALRWAPSAGNLQSRKFYFVFNEAIRNKLALAGFRHDYASFIARAPLVVVACADLNIASRYGERGADLYCVQDAAASVQNLLLAAHDLGLGTCWVGAFKEEQVKEILDLPGHLRPVVIVPVGYPAKTPKAPFRLPKSECVKVLP
jgi:nitroreductase